MSDITPSAVDSPRAWIIVIAAFLGAFVVFGVTYSFGVFMKTIAATFGASHASMTALFACLTVLSFFVAPLTGDIADKHGPRPVVAAGGILMGIGLVASARVKYFPLIFLTYGVTLGVASACIYVPCISAVGEWFKAHRDIALGISISGIGCGTLVAAPVAALLTQRLGWRSAFEIFGVASALLLLLAAALLTRPPVSKEKTDNKVMTKVCTRTFVLLYVSLTFAGIAVFVSFVFLPAYAGDIGISKVAGAALVGYIGASSVIGRLGLNALAPRYGLLKMYKVSYIVLLASFAIWLLARSYSPLVGFTLIMGVGYGGIAAMAPAVAASLFGIDGLGELLGILFTAFGLASLLGPPSAGIIVDHSSDYKDPVVLAAVAAVVAFAVLVPLKREPIAKEASAAAD